ncbi:MAG TPA: hypothetical protein VI793_20760 [Anaerolineales bacterium]|nr:hypothetical protein [Anaerolineales bacterium]HLE30566.1 hypothetical protein [Anaerolineales bacterium]
MKKYLQARKRLSAVAKSLAYKYRDGLDVHKAKHKDLNRSDFLWYCLLRSFATMGRSSGWASLIGDSDNFAQTDYDKLKRLRPRQRVAKLQKILSNARVIRWPSRKAGFLSACLDRIEGMGGLLAAKKKLLNQAGRDKKIAFLDDFPGIGNKYARNLMMDVYHKDFRDSIAIDSRIEKISEKLGLSFDNYEDEEQFFLAAAHEANLEGWELDRLMYNHLKEFLEQLGDGKPKHVANCYRD